MIDKTGAMDSLLARGVSRGAGQLDSLSRALTAQRDRGQAQQVSLAEGTPYDSVPTVLPGGGLGGPMAETAAPGVPTHLPGGGVEQPAPTRAPSLRAHMGQGDDVAALREKAQELEGVFLSQMLQHMPLGVDEGPFTGGNAERIYQSLLVEEYGKEMAKGGGIGIADAIVAQILGQRTGG